MGKEMRIAADTGILRDLLKTVFDPLIAIFIFLIFLTVPEISGYHGKSTDHGHDGAGQDQAVLPVLFELGDIHDGHIDQKCGRTVRVVESDLRCVDI